MTGTKKNVNFGKNGVFPPFNIGYLAKLGVWEDLSCSWLYLAIN